MSTILQCFGLSANKIWHNSRMSVGCEFETIRVQAEGHWNVAAAGRLCDANGLANREIAVERPLRQHPAGCLIGKVGLDGAPFFIGTEYVLSYQQGVGTLYLMINDDTVSLDMNHGALSIRLSKYHTFEY